MSEMERNKGLLVLVATGDKMGLGQVAKRLLKGVSCQCPHLDYLVSEGLNGREYMIIGNCLYLVHYSVKGADCYGFEEVVDHGESISFHTMHYNGGGSLQEVIEAAIERNKK